MSRGVLNLVLVLAASITCCAADVATRADLVQIFRREKFKLVYHVRDISEHAWTAAGAYPRGHGSGVSLVDPGYAWASEDYMDGPCQLLLAAKNARHEILCYWEATQGGPNLRVLVLRLEPKPRLIFHAIMYNDIPHERWTWGEIRGHVLQGRFDPIIPSDVGT